MGEDYKIYYITKGPIRGSCKHRHRNVYWAYHCLRNDFRAAQKQRRQESIYTVIELVGSSPTSWEDAVRNVVDTASESLRDLRIAEVTELDVRLDDKGKIAAYRAKVNLSFKYEKGGMD